MAKDGIIKIDGIITEVLPAGLFRVKTEEPSMTILTHLSGKMRTNKINLVLGDKVSVEMSIYDLTKGRIVYRHK